MCLLSVWEQVDQRALCLFMLSTTNNSFCFEKVRILDYEKNWTKRKIKESLYILKNISECVNFKMDSENISECYSLIVSLCECIVLFDYIAWTGINDYI